MALPTPFSRDGRFLRYHGEPVYLAGRYPELGDLPHAQYADYHRVLRKLAVQRNNFFRHWMMAYWHYIRPGNAYSPFRRQPGGKWDLNPPYNADYFARLDHMIRAALNHGIVVQLTFFDVPGLKAGADRWGRNPWNAANNVNGFIQDTAADGGVSEFYKADIPGLRTAQKNFVDHVVGSTMKYWNVCYEIINEGGGGDQAARVRWFDTVAGWIHLKTGGGRMIWHNDHSFPAQAASDVKFWSRSGYPNYARLDGVIVHFSPLSVDPDAERYADFNKTKAFQVSTDAFEDEATPDEDRQTFEWNAMAMPVIFGRKMVYQAEATCPDVGRAIGQAAPPPTDLRLGRFTHTLRGALGQTQIVRRFFMDAGTGFYIDYGTGGGVVGRGRVEDFEFVGNEQRIRLLDVGSGTSAWWRYTFNGDTLTLVNLTTQAPLTLQRTRRVPVDAFVPFLYNWERISNTGGLLQHFELRFDADGVMRTFRRNPYQEIDHHEIRAIDPAAGTITLHRYLNASTATLRYSFEKLRSGVRRLRLVNSAGTVDQVFEERAWYIPPMMVAATAGVPAAAVAAEAAEAAV